MAAMTDTDSAFVRICPSCGAASAPELMRCACGALLMGVDLVRAGASPAVQEDPPAAPAHAAVDETAQPIPCAHDDCGQPNPPGSARCLYCDRPLGVPGDVSASEAADAPFSLLQLPAPLAERYAIVRSLASRGAEAEILLVAPIAGGAPRIAKLFRAGILPDTEIQARLRRIDPHSCVQVFESGTAGGHAYEVMEFCAFGSLRERMQQGAIAAADLQAIIAEMATALAAAHAVGIVHRDIKPENILVRSVEPLDLILTDFSIASVLDATQCFTGMARTLMYAAPESLSGVIDAKADYWALGMLLLEAHLGRHPFAGLSDNVVLHHLSTRSIDLGAVADATLRKLLRGLLLRDPKQRWGAKELTRWLAGDASLEEAIDQDARSPVQPYRIGKDVCQSPEQLAVALARNWQAGISDLHNGQLQAWFRDEQKDQNTVRLLIDGKHEHPLPPDQQLLRLILHLAPGIPPVWRGEGIELRAILRHAAQALKGDAASARYLIDLYQSRVLEEYARAGNAELADLAQRWHGACDQFATRWKARLVWLRENAKARGVQEKQAFEDQMYGHAGPQQPGLSALLPRMLALLYDAAWEARLRLYLRSETLKLCATSPWLSELGDIATLDAAELLVVEALLPDARKVAARFETLTQQRAAEADALLRTLGDQSAETLSHLRAYERHYFFSPELGERLAADLGEYQRVLEQVRQQGSADARWQDLRKRLARIEPIAKRLQQELDRFSEGTARRSGWFGREMASFAALAFFILLPFVGMRLFWLPVGILLVLFVVFVGGPIQRMRRLRQLLSQI
ncbi:MAG: protein kinase [Uliginosibacterium sp.]|nr:protein kinase [Uliginosibacterium sp.]